MKQENNRLFNKGVRDLCAGARSWCGKLEAVSSTTRPAGKPAPAGRSFASSSGAEPRIDLRGVTLWLINAIRELIARLLSEETLHCEALAAVTSARDERNAAFQALRRQLQVLRHLDLADRDGPLIPPGRLPRRADQLTALAATVHPRLDRPDLEVPPWFEILPDAQQNLGWATAVLAAAESAVAEARKRSGEAREARYATMAELRGHLTAARSLRQALCDLRALER